MLELRSMLWLYSNVTDAGFTRSSGVLRGAGAVNNVKSLLVNPFPSLSPIKALHCNRMARTSSVTVDGLFAQKCPSDQSIEIHCKSYGIDHIQLPAHRLQRMRQCAAGQAELDAWCIESRSPAPFVVSTGGASDGQYGSPI
jgi:hypothetical protein